jgi:Flp pilus assembly protein TadG
MLRHSERGQVLPVWLFGIAGMLVLTLLVVQYGNMLAWQIRAQNAADSAAQAVIALQTQQFNEMQSVLYASAVEEYRIRSMLYSMEIAAFGNGGCSLDGSCAARYQNVYNAYLKAVARYQTDIVLLSRITSNIDATTMQSDAAALVAYLQTNCGNPGGGDCAFNYKLVSFTTRSSLWSVQMDARAVVKPSLGYHEVPAGTVNQSLQPAQAEVAVCADVPSLVPTILTFHPQTFRVIARAATTAAMMEQDWFQPGQLQNPWTQSNYQPVETPSGSRADDGSGYDWYAVNFGGNGNTANVNSNAYTFPIAEDEFSAFMGWWAGIPIRPYSGTQSDSQVGCTS